MILDQDLVFSDAQDIGQVAGTYVSTNAFDNGAAQTIPGGFGTVQKDPLRGLEGMELLIKIIEAVASGGAATVQFQLVQADDAALSSNVDVIAETPAIGYATLVAGYEVRLALPKKGITQRYFGLRYIIGTATTTAGTVTAALVPAIDSQPT